MSCSPAVSDGTCEAACACRITRARHSSANSQVVSGTGRAYTRSGVASVVSNSAVLLFPYVGFSAQTHPWRDGSPRCHQHIYRMYDIHMAGRGSFPCSSSTSGVHVAHIRPSGCSNCSPLSRSITEQHTASLNRLFSILCMGSRIHKGYAPLSTWCTAQQYSGNRGEANCR